MVSRAFPLIAVIALVAVFPHYFGGSPEGLKKGVGKEHTNEQFKKAQGVIRYEG